VPHPLGYGDASFGCSETPEQSPCSQLNHRLIRFAFSLVQNEQALNKPRLRVSAPRQRLGAFALAHRIGRTVVHFFSLPQLCQIAFLYRLSHIDTERAKAVAIKVKVSAPQGLLFTSALTLISQIECSGPIQGGVLAKQPADSDSLQTTLLRAREIAEELGEAVPLYFIDMAILEARRTNPPTAIDNKSRVQKE
jgi:hypothetical protein